MKKVLYVVLDGLGDLPVPQLGGRTPLEAAAVPFLGALTLDGRTGLVQTVGKGIAPESDVAVMAILGYDPFRYHTGRGVFEVVGSGMAFTDGTLALRGNFAHRAAFCVSLLSNLCRTFVADDRIERSD